MRASVWFIFTTILLDSIGLGILNPVFPDVIRRFTSDPGDVSRYFGAFVGVYAFMQFFASPLLGSLSDRFGRKPVLLISLFGAGLDYLFMAFAPTLSLLFLGRVVSGLTGASAAVASSAMADISDDSNRAVHFGMIGAAWGLGFILGPMIGGMLAGFGPEAPFIAASVLNLLNFAFGLFVLPETLPVELRRAITVKALNPFASILKILRPSPFVFLIWIYLLMYLAGQVHAVNWTLYTQTKFGWTAWEVGLSLSFVGLSIAISHVALPRLLVPKLGEERSLILGLFFFTTGYMLFALATQGWMVYAVMAYMALSGLAVPTLRSLIAKQVSAGEQGELQGSLVALGSVSSLIAPVVFTFLFVRFTDTEGIYFPGAAYMGAAVICGLALLIKSMKRLQ